MLFLVLLFSLMQIVGAYSQSHLDIKAQSAAEVRAKSLRIGDSIPQDFWDLRHHVINHSKGNQAVTLEDYKEKLVILDFWATWCVSMPDLPGQTGQPAKGLP